MAVALIAKDHLSPQAAAQVYGLLAAPLHPEDGGDLLLLASVWPDLVKDKGLRVFDTWHYQSLPYVQGSRRSTKAPGVSARDQDGQIVSIVEQCLVTLNHPESGPWEKAFMLRWLIHLVGDLHQPLHCVERFDRRFPKGDSGGLRFAVSCGAISNLHFLWDSGLGVVPDLRFADYRSSPDDVPSEALREFARKAQRDFPMEKLPQLGDTSPKAWAMESYRLARTVAYQGIRPGQVPGATYQAKGRRVVAQQMALAGYRLAMILNKLFEIRSPGLSK